MGIEPSLIAEDLGQCKLPKNVPGVAAGSDSLGTGVTESLNLSSVLDRNGKYA
jgi:hypothetical protein